MTAHLIISVDELWLKGKNRSSYLKSAVDHVGQAFKTYHKAKFSYKIQAGRLFYTSPVEFSNELVNALTKVPGLAYINRGKMLTRSPEDNLENVYDEILQGLSSFDDTSFTFRPVVKRIDKTFSMTSVMVAREIGHRVITRFPLAKADLKKPQLEIDVRILQKHVSISTDNHKGFGGLPWGSTGNAVTLLSGGFDSPVASYLMARRGVRQSFVFFHAYPFVGREVLGKIKGLVAELAKYQKQTHLYIVPYGEIQNLISKQCREEYRTLVFRRYMVQIANMICDKTNARALITGDCMGQVSSQTMENLHLIDKCSQRIILRPLIGFTKQDILKTATLIGTHDISMIPHDDACSLFAPKNPVINPDSEYWDNWDKDFDITDDLKRVLEKTEIFSVNMSGEFYKKDYFSFDG